MALEAQHRAAGAVLAEREGGPLALHFGDPSAELEAARERAGLVDRSHLGRLILTGSARATYLHRITAQATKDLRPPSGARASVLECMLDEDEDMASREKLRFREAMKRADRALHSKATNVTVGGEVDHPSMEGKSIGDCPYIAGMDRR